jgi:hypothetical protein
MRLIAIASALGRARLAPLCSAIFPLRRLSATFGRNGRILTGSPDCVIASQARDAVESKDRDCQNKERSASSEDISTLEWSLQKSRSDGRNVSNVKSAMPLARNHAYTEIDIHVVNHDR